MPTAIKKHTAAPAVAAAIPSPAKAEGTTPGTTARMLEQEPPNAIQNSPAPAVSNTTTTKQNTRRAGVVTSGGGKQTRVAARAAAVIAIATTTNKYATVSPLDPTGTSHGAPPAVVTATSANKTNTKNKNTNQPTEDDEKEGTRNTLSSVFTGTLEDVRRDVFGTCCAVR